MQLPGSLARGSRAFPGHPQGPHLRAHRCAGGRPDHLAPGAARGRAQLGLPLLLAARRDLHALRSHDGRLRGGGPRLARLAGERRGRDAVRDPDHVRPGRGEAPARAGAGLAARSPWLPAGTDRQRRREPAPTRRVRRGDGCPASRPAGGSRAERERVACAAGVARVPGDRLEAARRRDLGGAGTAPPLRAFQGDGVGGDGPGRPGGRGGRGCRATPGPGGGCATRSTPRSAARGSTASWEPSSSTTAPSSSTPAC